MWSNDRCSSGIGTPINCLAVAKVYILCETAKQFYRNFIDPYKKLFKICLQH